MSGVLGKCASLESYVANCVIDCGYNKLCLFCKTAVSDGSGARAANSTFVKAHYEKFHVPREGGHWCNPCGRTVANAGQTEQVELHGRTAKHQKCLGGSRYCVDCAAVDPPSNHNAAHTIKHLDEVALIKEIRTGEVNQTQIVGETKKRDLEMDALILMAIVDVTAHTKEHMTTRILCNEDFEKIFRKTPSQFPFTLVNAVKGDCTVCRVAAAFDCGIKVHTGHGYQLRWVDVEKYFQYRRKKVFVLKDFISLAEVSGVNPEVLKEHYEYDASMMRFVLKEDSKQSNEIDVSDDSSVAETFRGAVREADVKVNDTISDKDQVF